MTEPEHEVWVVAFVGKKGISEMYPYKSKAAAVRAKRAWDREWQSSEEAVVYRAILSSPEART